MIINENKNYFEGEITMSNEIKIWENSKFGTVRTVEIDGEPWLVGNDVAETLGYSNP